MINLKTQFEVRFTNILAFDEIYKAVISPFIHGSEFTIDVDTPYSHKIILTFRPERYFIDCRWDRLILVAEGPRSDLKTQQGPFFKFFEIYKCFQHHFVHKAMNAYLAEWNLIDSESNYTVQNFTDTFFTEKLNYSLPDLPDKDSSITLEFGTDKQKLIYTFGPFNYKKDVKNYNLNVVTKSGVEEYKKYNGILVQAIYNQPTESVDMDTYRTLSKSISNKIAITI